MQQMVQEAIRCCSWGKLMCGGNDAKNLVP